MSNSREVESEELSLPEVSLRSGPDPPRVDLTQRNVLVFFSMIVFYMA